MKYILLIKTKLPIEHFARIAEKIDSKTPKSKRKVTDYLKYRNLNSFFLKPVNEKEIQNIISNTANNKAVGRNSVPNFLLKQFKEELSIPFSLIINMSFKTGISPQACKLANIIPKYKKVDKLDCFSQSHSYRMLEKLSNNVCMEDFANSSVKLTVFMQNNLALEALFLLTMH